MWALTVSPLAVDPRFLPLLRTYIWGMCSQAHGSELNHTQLLCPCFQASCTSLAFVSIPQAIISPGVSPVNPSPPIPFLREEDHLPAALGDICLQPPMLSADQS